jgi:hypothetical protein
VNRADRLAELQAMHAKVHAVREQPHATPLIEIQLRGVEDTLDWLLETCPDGDFDPVDFDPVDSALECDYRIVVVRGDERQPDEVTASR